MRIAYALLLAACLSGISACNHSDAVRATDDTVVATPSVAGQVTAVDGGNGRVLALTFNTSDGRLAHSLQVTTNLATLPSGWTTADQSFTCSSVSTGNGCVLSLTFAPTSMGSGTLTLTYQYRDDANVPQSGSVGIAYAATAADNVGGAAFPTGQVGVVVGGSQSVTAVFITDDGTTATNFSITGSLNNLPSGWSANPTTLNCANVSTGNSCALALTYTPTLAANGTLILDYAYTNDEGAPGTGALAIPYSATTNDNIQYAVSPSANISVFTGTTQAVTVTFDTDDGNTAAGLSVTSGLSNLPGGWSSTSNSFACSSVSTGSACQLVLSYAPTETGNGTLTLGYGYTDNAGVAKTGTVSITYAATTAHAYIADAHDTVWLCSLGSSGSLTNCASTGNGFITPQAIVFNGNDAYISDFNGTIWICVVNVDATLSACTSGASGFLQPGFIAVNAGYLYVPNLLVDPNGMQYCSFGSGGALSGCTHTDGPGSQNQASSVTFWGQSAYVGTVDFAYGPGVNVCSIANDGSLSGCIDAGSGAQAADDVVAIDNTLFILNDAVEACPIGTGGALSACTSSTVTINGNQAYPIGGLAILNAEAYLSYVYYDVNMHPVLGLAICTVGSDNTLSNCADSGLSMLGSVQGITIH